MINIKQKTFNQLAGLIFTLAALVHLWRVLTGAEMVLAGWSVPAWLSLLGVVAAGYLAYSAYKLMK